MQVIQKQRQIMQVIIKNIHLEVIVTKKWGAGIHLRFFFIECYSQTRRKVNSNPYANFDI